MRTNLTRVLRLYGLAKPYDFARAIPFLLGAALIVLILVCAVSYTLAGALTPGSVRFYFFVYVLLLALGAALLARLPKLSLLLAGLCFLELSVALGTSALKRLNDASPSLMPDNNRAIGAPPRFLYHPLLAAVPAPGYASDVWVSETLKVHVEHNSHGFRGKEIGSVVDKTLIFAYGGSTTYDIGISQGSTWTERLEAGLGDRSKVINMGVPGYSTVEHVIQGAFYADVLPKPACSLYFIGWNDIRNAHLPRLDGAYADFHLPSQLDNLEVRGTGPLVSPVALIAYRYLKRWLDTPPMPAIEGSYLPKAGTDPKLERIFRRNVELIALLNTQRKIKTIFIGQVLNRNELRSEDRYGWLPLVKNKDVWPLQEHFNAILEKAAADVGASYVKLNINDFGDGDFVDHGHFSPNGAAKFARLILSAVADGCQGQK